MRFSLRTLVVVMLLGGPVLAVAFWVVAEGAEQVRRGNEKPLHALAAIAFVALAFGLLLSQRKTRVE